MTKILYMVTEISFECVVKAPNGNGSTTDPGNAPVSTEQQAFTWTNDDIWHPGSKY